MGISTIAEGAGAKALTEEYVTLRRDKQAWSQLKGFKGAGVKDGPPPKVIHAGGPASSPAIRRCCDV